MRRNISYKGKLASELISHIQLVNLPLGILEDFLKYRVEKEGAHYSQVKIGHLNPGHALVKFLKTNFLIPEYRDNL